VHSPDSRDPENTSRPAILFVVGTRPEAIKMLPVIMAFRDRGQFRPVVVSTGQHTRLVRDVLRLGAITPDIEFPEVAGERTLNALFAHVTKCMDEYLRTAFPADQNDPAFPVATFVHGDTTSAAAAALASFQAQIPVAHVEAGLRTNDTGSPFPEELNRQLIGRIATTHFAPTPTNLDNLLREGVPEDRVIVTGNTSIDALMWVSSLRLPYSDPRLAMAVETADYGTPVIVVTAHRRESWGAGLENIGRGIRRIAELHPHAQIVLPLHPNPIVSDTLGGILDGLPNVLLTEPLDYAEFARLLGRATLVVTDSGGVQEEAPALGVPVLVMRETTERVEGVVAGTLELVGTDPDAIVAAASRLLNDRDLYLERTKRANPYGDGRAAWRIAEAWENRVFGDALPKPAGGRATAGDLVEAPAA
jgi:UDP-N-acetylglucosamine 2-epimerase (non-hydrolysing)